MEVTHLTLPDNQAALAPFPPGCPVLVSGSSGDSETSAAVRAQAYLGQIHCVYIDLGSTTRDNFYRVRPSSAAPTETATELRSAAESALKYAPGCTVTVNASALPPFVTEGGGGDTRDATIISCVGGGGSSNYYLLEVMPGPSDSWTNIQSTVPVDSVRYRVPTEEPVTDVRAPEPAPAPVAQVPQAVANDDDNGDQGARVISPHPHTIPADEDGSSLNSSSRAPPVPSITINTDRKRSAEQLDCDGGSSTLSPMPTDGSISIASSNVIAEEVVRRIDIPDTVDANKVEGALIGPDNKIKERMQAKFRVTISILGLDDAISSSAMESFSKLGPISYKVGDKCIMIQGSERKVHDAAKVVIHMLVNKCYDGNDKNALTRELRVVRQVRKKAELSPRSESARADLPSPTKKLKAGPAAAQGVAASLAAAAKDPVERGWSPPIEDGSSPDVSDKNISRNSHGETEPPNPLFMGVPRFNGKNWGIDVRSPIDQDALFGRIIGKESSRKRELIDMFGGKVFFSLRGEGIRKKDGITGEADTSGPLRVFIRGPDSEIVQSAAEYVAGLLDRKPPKATTYGQPSGSALPDSQHQTTLSCLPAGPMRLVSDPIWVGGDRATYWQVVVKSPIPERSLFGCLVGEGGENKKMLERKFSDAFFNIRGEGVPLRNGGQSEGPLRVEVEGNDKEYLLTAARHVAEILLSDLHSTNSNQFRSTGADSRHGRNRLLMEEPNSDGRNWFVKLISPLDRDSTFDVVIGPRGLNKEALERQFPGCFFFLRGKGSGSARRGIQGVDIDAPLHILIKAPDRSIVEDASSHLTEILQNEAGGTNVADSSRPDRSLCPASAVPVDTQYGMQEWKATVFASSVRLGDTSTYFGSIVGPGGSTLRNIQKEFGVNITVLGEGVSSSDLDHDPRDPMNARIVGPSRQSVDDAALHIDRLWANVAGATTNANSTTQVNPNQRQAHGVTAQPTSETRALLSGNPLYDDQSSTWFLDVFSPLDQCSTFGVLIGEGGKEKKKLIQMFDRKVFFCLRGDGLQSKNAAGDSSGPLRVFVQGPAPDVVIFAAENIACVLLERKRAEDSLTPRNSSYRADSFGHYGDTNSDYRRDRQRTRPPQSGSLEASMNLLGEPFHTGMRWAMMVHSPLDEQPLFNVIVGGGGVNKKKLTRAFPNVFFTIAGRGVRSNGSVRMTHRKSDDPLHVLVEAADKEILLVASKHVAMIVSDAASAQSSHRYY